MIWQRAQRWLPSLLLVALTAIDGFAHQDPEDDAVQLSAKIGEDGASAALLCKRARRWRTMRRLDLAITDWKAALELDPKSFEAGHELAKGYLSDGNLKQAHATVNKLIDANSAQPAELAHLHMLRAIILTLWKSYKKAESDCDRAFALLPGHGRIDWYLRRAHVQRMRDRFQACAAGLKGGYEANGSMVLYAEWVEAMIDAKDYATAKAEIESQLPGLRFSALWQIRLARVLFGEDKDDDARAALARAKAELDTRIKAEGATPDLTLHIDRACLRLLSGDRRGARRDYHIAKSAGADGWMLWRLEKAFR